MQARLASGAASRVGRQRANEPPTTFQPIWPSPSALRVSPKSAQQADCNSACHNCTLSHSFGVVCPGVTSTVACHPLEMIQTRLACSPVGAASTPQLPLSPSLAGVPPPCPALLSRHRPLTQVCTRTSETWSCPSSARRGRRRCSADSDRPSSVRGNPSLRGEVTGRLRSTAGLGVTWRAAPL